MQCRKCVKKQIVISYSDFYAIKIMCEKVVSKGDFFAMQKKCAFIVKTIKGIESLLQTNHYLFRT